MGLIVKDVIGRLEYNELMKLEYDLSHGGTHLLKLVSAERKKREKEHECICATCQAPVSGESRETYTLMFGPADFKKKATFCGRDCLSFFLQSLPERQEGVTAKEH